MAALPDRTIVVSPHLDDAVLSLGAAIAATARAGREIRVVTVFAGDPGSRKPAGGWDKRGGFETEGEAVRARRLEDSAACVVLGATPVWLSFSEADYRETLDAEQLGRAISAELDSAEAVLLPGHPLTNPDHAWLTRLCLSVGPAFARVGVYMEQPYLYWSRHTRPPQASITEILGPVEWLRLGTTFRHLRAKRQAVREYRSQLPLLGLHRGRPSQLDRLLAHEALSRGEAIAWLSGR